MTGAMTGEFSICTLKNESWETTGEGYRLAESLLQGKQWVYQASVLQKHTSIVNSSVCVLNAGQWMTQSGTAGYENNAWVCASVGTEPGKETKPKKEQKKISCYDREVLF